MRGLLRNGVRVAAASFMRCRILWIMLCRRPLRPVSVILFQAWVGCTTAVIQLYDGRHTHFMATVTRAYGGRRKFSVSRSGKRHDSVKFLPRVKKALCFRRFPLGISGVQPLPVARRGGPSADIPPLPHHENDMENYFCKYSSTCAAMSLPLARALTTRLAPLAASPATKTFSG